MNIESERTKELQAYISKNFDAKLGEWPLEVDGNVGRYPFYRLPVSLLRYNVNNGRLAMEVREWMNTHHRTLDANDPDDAKEIRNLLLSLDEKDTNILKIDLNSKGQIEPGVITHDGYVINGNRRMAILHSLHEEMPSGKWEYLDAILLPPNISEKSLWKIEAGLQLSKDKIAEYHPVNELLKIKQGIDAGLKPIEVATAMYGRTEEEIESALERLELIDEFLDFFGQPSNYGLIKKFGMHEHFIDVQKTVLGPAKRQSLPKREIHKHLGGAFALMRAGILIQSDVKKKRKKGVTHWDIRALGKIYGDTDAQLEYMNHLVTPNKEKGNLSSIDPEIIIEGFDFAQEVLSNKENRDRPLKLIEKAIKAIESIDRNNKHLKEDRVASAIARLQKLVTNLSAEIKSK